MMKKSDSGSGVGAKDYVLVHMSQARNPKSLTAGVQDALKGEVQSRITIISKERVKISLQIGANMMKIG